jgi:hypothetical protein
MEVRFIGVHNERIMAVCVSALLAAVFLLPVNGAAAHFMRDNADDLSNIPGPTLLCPVTDRIDLTGKESLSFKWERTDSIRIREYDFRLYKGYATVESTRILKKRVPVDDYPITIAGKEFDLNQVYTWVLTEIYDNGMKSDKSSSSFKIIKK